MWLCECVCACSVFVLLEVSKEKKKKKKGSKDWKVVEKSIGQSKHNTQLTWKTLKDEECFVENRFFVFFLLLQSLLQNNAR